jgi:hypothetical protein
MREWIRDAIAYLFDISPKPRSHRYTTPSTTAPIQNAYILQK